MGKLQGSVLLTQRQSKFVTHVAHIHQVFKGLVKSEKNLVGWHFGFKLHLVINERGELLAFKLTPTNVDDREPVTEEKTITANSLNLCEWQQEVREIQ